MQEVPAVQKAKEDRVLTVPNAITVVRLACVPWFVYLLLGRDQRADAASLLAVLGCTDWIDGRIARRWHQVSSVGKVLDPAADRIMLLVGVWAILVDGSVPVAVAILTLSREAFVTVVALVLAGFGARRVDVTWVGKAGAFWQMIAYPLFLAGNSDLFWADTADVLAWVTIVPGLALSWWAVVTYVPLVRAALPGGAGLTAEQDV